MDNTEKELLIQIADLHETPNGNYNIIRNGKTISRASSQDIEIVSKKNGSGIDVNIKPNIKNKNIYLPTLVTVCGKNEEINNDIFIGKNADVTITIGSGIDSDTCDLVTQENTTTFQVGEGAKVKLIEKYFAAQNDKSTTELSIVTKIKLSKNSQFEIDTSNLGGISKMQKKTVVKLIENSKLKVSENLNTSNDEILENIWDISMLKGESEFSFYSKANAKKTSVQRSVYKIKGNAKGKGNIEINGEVLDMASIVALPEINLNNPDAQIVFNAKMGKK